MITTPRAVPVTTEANEMDMLRDNQMHPSQAEDHLRFSDTFRESTVDEEDTAVMG